MNQMYRVKGMFRRKAVVAVECIILIVLLFIGISLYEKHEVKHEETLKESPVERPSWDNEYGPVTFYELFKDYNRSRMRFTSYIPGDTVIVKDRIAKAAIEENQSIVHRSKDYDYSVNIWLDSMKELNDYYEIPTFSVVGDWGKSTMKSFYGPGNNITINFTISSSKLHSDKSDLSDNDNSTTRRGPSGIGILEDPTGIKVLDVNCTINDDRTEVEEIHIKGVVHACSPAYDLHNALIKVYWKDVDTSGQIKGRIFLQHQNNTGNHFQSLHCRKIENTARIYAYETIFDHIGKTIPTDADSFWHEKKRDMDPVSSEGIITPGDVVNIIFNFTQLHQPSKGDGLGPGSFVKIEIHTRYGIPSIAEFFVPDTFPKGEKYVHLSPLEE